MILTAVLVSGLPALSFATIVGSFSNARFAQAQAENVVVFLRLLIGMGDFAGAMQTERAAAAILKDR